ncbi:MAG: phosphatase PAP2 family protein [Anaerolineaceae bacterium]|nr:MAG: phosphatase PAP2 family protein [Anaerolineaceae bacterium]
MSPWLEWGIPVITWLQGLGDWLIAPMRIITFMGNEELLLILLPTILWCFDVGLGFRVGLIYIISGGFSASLKLLFGTPRPFWVSKEVRALSTSYGFSLPSGHSLGSMAVYGRIAVGIATRWAYIIFGSLIALIGISRVFLAVHFPTDVIAGFLVGGLLLFLFIRFEKPWGHRLRQMSLGYQIVVAVIASLILLGLGVGVNVATAGRTVPLEWIETAAEAVPDADPIKPQNLKDLLSASGALLGVGVGGALLFSWDGFNPRGPWSKRAIRYIVGIIGIVALYFGLKLVFPSGETLLAQFLRYVRYAVVGFWAAYGAPRIFVALGLA